MSGTEWVHMTFFICPDISSMYIIQPNSSPQTYSPNHPYHTTHHTPPSNVFQIHDFCDPFIVTRASPVTSGLELSGGAWWGHQWVYN